MTNTDTHRGPSFPLADRIRRLAWNLACALVFRPSPRSLHGWRRSVLRVFGARVGRGVHIYPAVRIWAPWNLDLADACGVGDGAILYSQGRISVGRQAVVSQGAHLCAGTHDFEQPGFPLVTKPIVVGAHAWLAAECFIHPGVTIGEGAVIGARAVVTRDMPAWTVCAGHPCAPLRPRRHPDA